MDRQTENGVLVVDKPAGITSHRVLERLKRVARGRKLGHGGTLDPFATGVLPVFVGRATRLVQFFLHGDKEYEGLVRFGLATDTHDLDGAPLAPPAPCAVAHGDLEGWLEGYRGRIRQRPPAFSAVKWQGESLHVYARRGRPVEAREREVEIRRLDLLDWSPPDLHLRILCSAGTYIRVLAHALGEQAGCGAHLAALRRIRSGPFAIGQAVTLAELEDDPDLLAARLLPMESLLPEYPVHRCPPEEIPKVRNGNEISVPMPLSVGETVLDSGTLPPYLRLLNPDGALVAVARVRGLEGDRLKVHPAIVLI